MLKRIGPLALLIVLLAGCTTPPPREATSAAREGRWYVERPNDEPLTGRIARIADNRYRLSDMLTLSGDYELWRDTLIMRKPVHDSFQTLVWRIESPERLILIKAPAVWNVGRDYSGTVARRLEDTPTP